MRFDSHQSILNKLVAIVPESTLVELCASKKLSSTEEILIYHLAQENRLRRVLLILLRSSAIKNRIAFFGEQLFRSWVEAGRFEMLDLPQFDCKGLEFKEVVEDIIGPAPRPVIKKLAELSLKQGARVLNNYQNLRYMYRSKEINIHEFIKLDHSQKIQKLLYLDSNYTEALLRNYSIRRCVKLLNSPEEEFEEVDRMAMQFGPTAWRTVIKSRPRNPRSLKDLLPWLGRELNLMFPPDAKLEQIIEPWHGRTIGTYRAVVPTENLELDQYGTQLSNCLGTRYTWRVMKKEVQILILLEEEKPKIAVEIMANQNGWRVRDILGFNNNTVGKRVFTEYLRGEIQKWCDELPVIRKEASGLSK